jgi:uncharacterized protein YwqG
MNYLKKLFGKNDENLVKLEMQVQKLVKSATRIELKNAAAPVGSSSLKSHFGGLPYFEEGETWPITKAGKHLEFIFQIFNQPELNLPEEIKLIQFYYDWDELPWDTENDGWFVKIYKVLNDEKKLSILKPKLEREFTNYCEIEFTTFKSLPDWEGIDVYDETISDICCLLNEDEPWDYYDQIVTKLIGEPDYQSQLGGYPQWVQGEAVPQNQNGDPMRLLFQIDSEERANLEWGSCGSIYVFYDETQNKIEFTLQCT